MWSKAATTSTTHRFFFQKSDRFLLGIHLHQTLWPAGSPTLFGRRWSTPWQCDSALCCKLLPFKGKQKMQMMQAASKVKNHHETSRKSACQPTCTTVSPRTSTSTSSSGAHHGHGMTTSPIRRRVCWSTKDDKSDRKCKSFDSCDTIKQRFDGCKSRASGPTLRSSSEAQAG